MNKKSMIDKPGFLPSYERPLGRMISESRGTTYLPLRSLEEARAEPDGYVVLQGDDGGQIYVVAPASSVRCTSEALQRLLRHLDEIAWPGNYENMRRVFFERLTLGAVVAGGMGGGVVSAEPWIHAEFVSLGLQPAILAVLRGERESIR